MPEEKIPDQKTQKLLDLFESIIKESNTSGKDIFLTGGFAVDIQSAIKNGNTTLMRNHDDLDIHCPEQDIPFWRQWFETQGFRIDGNYEIADPTKAFVATSSNSKCVYDRETPDVIWTDVYGIEIDEKSGIWDNWLGHRRAWKIPFTDLLTSEEWNGNDILMEKYEHILANKRKENGELKEPPREKDIFDHALFGIQWNGKEITQEE